MQDTLKRTDEEFSNTETANNINILTKLKNCAINIGAGKRLNCNKYD